MYNVLAKISYFVEFQMSHSREIKNQDFVKNFYTDIDNFCHTHNKKDFCLY